MKKNICKLLTLLLAIGLFIASAPAEKVKAADTYTVTINVANAVDVDGNPIESSTVEVEVGESYSSPNYYFAPGHQLPKTINIGGVNFNVASDSSVWTDGTNIEQYNNWVRFIFTPKADTTVTVTMPAKSYKVNFDPNGGEGTVNAIDGEYGKPVQLPSDGFTREKYELIGWNTKADGTGDSFRLGEKTTLDEQTTPDVKDVTLYAEWGYSVGIELDTASVEWTDKVGYKGATDDGLEPDAVQETITATSTGTDPVEFIMAGFKDSTSYEQFTLIVGGMEATVAPKEGLKKGTYEAVVVISDFEDRFEPLEIPVKFTVTGKDVYKITLDLDGGTLDGKEGPIVNEYVEETEITLPEPTKEGYTFDYWEGSKYNAGDKYIVVENHTFKAIWVEDEPTPEPKPKPKPVTPTYVAPKTGVE